MIEVVVAALLLGLSFVGTIVCLDHFSGGNPIGEILHRPWMTTEQRLLRQRARIERKRAEWRALPPYVRASRNPSASSLIRTHISVWLREAELRKHYNEGWTREGGEAQFDEALAVVDEAIRLAMEAERA